MSESPARLRVAVGQNSCLPNSEHGLSLSLSLSLSLCLFLHFRVAQDRADPTLATLLGLQRRIPDLLPKPAPDVWTWRLKEPSDEIPNPAEYGGSEANCKRRTPEPGLK